VVEQIRTSTRIPGTAPPRTPSRVWKPGSRGTRDRRMVNDADWHIRASGTLETMPTLVRDPQPAEFEALLERRRRLGQDLFDEVWEGVLHMNPAPSRRHARIEAQLLAILQAPAAAAG
jgi:hypothetical protein